MVLFASVGHYRSRITLSIARDARTVVACSAVPFLLAGVISGHGTVALLALAGSAAGSLLVLRAFTYGGIRSLRSRGFFGERALIIGAGPVGVTLASTLVEHPEFGLRPIGFLDDVDSAGLPYPLLGKVDSLARVLVDRDVERVIVAFGVTRESEMVDIFRVCDEASVDIHVLPRFFELGLAVDERNVDDVWGFPLLRLHRNALRSFSWACKRAFDRTLAALILVLIAPLYGLLALLVKISSPGPVHFRQKRVGQRGEVVEMLKFRSMVVHNGTDVEWTAAANGMTRIGRIMRKFSLDELPQLWNIVRGDMSFVGPRPERPFFAEQFKTEIPHYNERHRVPVGLTGLAQVNGLRGDTSIAERARFDNLYIENWKLSRDLVILGRTVSTLLRGTGK
jgi:exopolysaccharide biosynthesis polyprenyl glycosylphosphotransferase